MCFYIQIIIILLLLLLLLLLLVLTRPLQPFRSRRLAKKEEKKRIQHGYWKLETHARVFS